MIVDNKAYKFCWHPCHNMLWCRNVPSLHHLFHYWEVGKKSKFYQCWAVLYFYKEPLVLVLKRTLNPKNNPVPVWVLNWFQKSDLVPVRFLLTGIGASSSNPPDWVPAQQESFVGLAYYQARILCLDSL